MDYGFPIQQRSELVMRMLEHLVTTLQISQLTDAEIVDVCKPIIERFGQGADFEENLPVYSAGLLPMRELTRDIGEFLVSQPGVGDIEAIDPEESNTAISYLIDVCDNLGFTDEDIASMASTLELIGIAKPEFRFQLVPPKHINLQLHLSGDRDYTLASVIGRIISEHERVSKEPENPNDPWDVARKPEDAYHAIVKAYRQCIAAKDTQAVE
jgi:hypothetical protein